MSEIPTPRTDAVTFITIRDNPVRGVDKIEVVTAAHARQLEKELHEERANRIASEREVSGLEQQLERALR